MYQYTCQRITEAHLFYRSSTKLNIKLHYCLDLRIGIVFYYIPVEISYLSRDKDASLHHITYKTGRTNVDNFGIFKCVFILSSPYLVVGKGPTYRLINKKSREHWKQENVILREVSKINVSVLQLGRIAHEIHT